MDASRKERMIGQRKHSPVDGGIRKFAPDKKIMSRTFKISGTLVFLCPKERERERKRERERERERAIARAIARA
jgi:hypothetical protein